MTQPNGLKLEKYERLPFTIEAVEVTADNMKAVAKWCGGQIRTSGKRGIQKYIKVEVKRALNDRQTQAYIGDFVLKAGSGFKVYTPKAFSESFRKVEVAGRMLDREESENQSEDEQYDTTTEDSLPTGGTNTSFISAG
jgi:hypothetical protein